MPKAGWCAACGRYVWVSPEGGCQNGHGPEMVSGVYDGGGDAGATPAAWTPTEPHQLGMPVLTKDLADHLWRRCFAFATDYAIAMVLTLAASLALGFGGALYRSSTGNSLPTTALAQVLAVVVLFGYFFVSEGIASTTIGKRLLGLRVIGSRTGARISWGQAFARNLALFLDLLFFGLVGIAAASTDGWRRRLGDRIARTVVVYADESAFAISPTDAAELAAPRAEKVSPVLVWLAILVALGLAAVIGVAAISAFAPPSITRLFRPAPSALEQAAQEAADEEAAAAADAADAGSSIDLSGVDPTPGPSEAAAPPDPPAQQAARMTAAQYDEFIAKEYPGYRVSKRIPERYSWAADRGGQNYLLVNERQPTFRLLVTVAQLRAGETLSGNAPSGFYLRSGDVVTTDQIFSAAAKAQIEYLRGKAQDALINAYVAKRQPKTAIVCDAYTDAYKVSFSTADGPDAISDAITGLGATGHLFDATLPTGPDHSKVTLIIDEE